MHEITIDEPSSNAKIALTKCFEVSFAKVDLALSPAPVHAAGAINFVKERRHNLGYAECCHVWEHVENRGDLQTFSTTIA